MSNMVLRDASASKNIIPAYYYVPSNLCALNLWAINSICYSTEIQDVGHFKSFHFHLASVNRDSRQAKATCNATINI